MRITTTLVAAGVLLWASLPAIAEKIEFKDEAHFNLRAASRYQREVLVIFPAANTAPDSTLTANWPTLAATSFLVLEDCCDGTREMTQQETEGKQDPDAAVLRRRKLVAAFEAGIAKLGVAQPQRKFVRITAIAVEASSSDAMKLYAAGKIDCDQLILLNPIIEELPTIGAGLKPRAIDAVFSSRNDAESQRLREDVLDKFGPWGNSARVFTGSGAWDIMRVYELFRGYQILPTAGDSGTDNAKRRPANLKALEDACGQADVVFVGELHGNPGAHALQFDVLQFMGKASKKRFALSTEQFERDAQAALNAFMDRDLKDLSPEELAKLEDPFTKETRAWPNYADYRPLVEFCRENKRSVIAGNVPRPLAARINKEGPEAFEKFTTEEKAWCASKINAPDGAYKDKFFEVMGSSTSAKKDDKYAAMERMYTAQCLKDDTMAESIVAWLDNNRGGQVVHINGAFHSANSLGVPEKLKALRPGLKIVVITCVEADNPFSAEIGPEDMQGNDFVVFVPGSRPNRSNEGPAHPK